MKNEIILYRPQQSAEHLEVRVEGETVWLSLKQMTQLFGRDKSVISRHLKHVFEEGELIRDATVAYYATVQNEAGRKITRNIEFYNLDAILSVGYRVNSKQGTQFRIWANQVLKDYLLKGYAVQNRIMHLENKVDVIDGKVSQIELKIQSQDIPKQGVFFEGQVFDAYELASRIIRSAKNEIVLIDNYIDESTLLQLSKKQEGVRVTLLCKNLTKMLRLDVAKAKEQFGSFELKPFSKSHDRFLILDQTEIYHLGASLKDLGKKWFAFTKIEQQALQTLLAAVEEVK
jgi:hypothetical protein